jgi:hypothetical protein
MGARKESQTKAKLPLDSKSKKSAPKDEASDEEMDFDAIPTPPPRAVPKRTARAGVNKKYVISEDDEDEDDLYEDD